jgi:hypothetical protein
VSPDASNDPTALEVLRLLTTDKSYKNFLISTLTHSADIEAVIRAQVTRALAEAGALTLTNVHASDGLYNRISETGYESAQHALADSPDLAAIKAKLGVPPQGGPA